MTSRFVFRFLVLAVFAAGLASAQGIDFTLEASSNGQSELIPNGQTLGFLTTAGTQEQITVTGTYEGTTQATIIQPTLQQLGSTEFKVTSTNLAVGTVLNHGDSFTLVITFSPTSTSQALGTLAIFYTEPGAGGTVVQSEIQLGLEGQSPQFTLSYVLQTDNNVVQIPSGGTIPFNPTQIKTVAQANFNITDTGSGAGVITGVSLTSGGPIFKLQGTPLFPSTLSAGQTLQLLVTYNPTAVGTDTGQIQITYQGGATATVNLTGSGVTSNFTYKYVALGVSKTVEAGGTITFPGATIGTTTGNTSSVIVQVTNTGSASGTINSVSTSPGFTLTNPITLPVTLTAGNTFSVPLTFTPTQIGTQTGQLQIGNDFFNLSGQGLGPNLTFAYTSSAGTTTVDPTTGGAVLFNPVQVGQSEKVTFTVTNSGSGSTPATITLVGTNPSNGPFTVSPPALPKTLLPKQSLSFSITFAPTVQGISDGTLVVNTTTIQLSGNAGAPLSLPSYSLTGPSGDVAPATQSNVSLTLSKGYALDLIGTLTLTTQGDFGTDPAVQFATGSRTVDFTIPANSTSADFAGQGSQIFLQTGTVAETVTLAPTFTTTGGESVTPASPTTLQFTIPSSAPVLETAVVGDETTNSFALQLTGYSTTRSLTSLNVTFNPAPGFNIGTAQISIDLSQVSTAWFQSPASVSFGGLFQVSMPFTLTGTPKAGQTLVESIASVTATVSNSTGTSGSLQASLQ